MSFVLRNFESWAIWLFPFLLNLNQIRKTGRNIYESDREATPTPYSLLPDPVKRHRNVYVFQIGYISHRTYWNQVLSKITSLVNIKDIANVVKVFSRGKSERENDCDSLYFAFLAHSLPGSHNCPSRSFRVLAGLIVRCRKSKGLKNKVRKSPPNARVPT